MIWEPNRSFSREKNPQHLRQPTQSKQINVCWGKDWNNAYWFYVVGFLFTFSSFVSSLLNTNGWPYMSIRDPISLWIWHAIRYISSFFKNTQNPLLANRERLYISPGLTWNGSLLCIWEAFLLCNLYLWPGHSYRLDQSDVLSLVILWFVASF